MMIASALLNDYSFMCENLGNLHFYCSMFIDNNR